MTVNASYLRPRTLESALQVLSRGTHLVIAGGTDIYPALVGRQPPAAALDITAIDELHGIDTVDTDDGRFVRLGATTTWTELLHADLPPACQALATAAGHVGAAQVQHAGTVAGNLCTASPAGDGIPVLLALDASVELTSPRGVRRLPVDHFVIGYRRTALAADELVTAIWIPLPPGEQRSSFVKCSTRSSLVISLAMVAVAITRDDAGTITNSRVAVGACSPVAVRLPAVERALVAGARRPWTTADFAELSPIDDVRATAAYRLAVLPTLIDDAVDRCHGGADG